MPTPPKVFPAVEDYDVSFNKGGTDMKIGMLLRKHGAFLLIREVYNDSLTSKWNVENPRQQIEQGDLVVETNGIREDSSLMLKECTDKLEVKLVIRRRAKIERWYSTASESMRFRTMRPEDFELLKFYDKACPAKTSLPKALVARLPRVQRSQCSDDMCAICFSDYRDGERVTKLPCGHHYCTKCITTWLTEDKNECPQCRAEVVIPEIPEEEAEPRHPLKLSL
jgi:hypothetical protein